MTANKQTKKESCRKQVYRLIFSMNIGENILKKKKKVLANQSQQYMKKILHHGVYSRDPSIVQHPQTNVVYHTEKMKGKSHTFNSRDA